MRVLPALPLAAALTACVTTPARLPPAQVAAVTETTPVGTAAEDAADDPAIWRNAADPAASLIVATDKKAGLYVYGLDGQARSFAAGGLLNNVDLADMGTAGVIVVASDRNDPVNAQLRIYRLDTASAELTPLGTVPGGAGEGYGLCLHERDGELLAYSVLKEGTVHEYRLSLSGTPTAEALRSFGIATQTEGCVVDPRDGTLYVGEEEGGIWRFAPGTTEGELVAPVDNRYLVADVEGLALLPEGERGGWLVASSQGDHAFAVFRLPGLEPVGRFAVAEGATGAVEETDGIALMGGNFGPGFPSGLFVAQDGWNEPKAQNFKLVSWEAVEAALGLR